MIYNLLFQLQQSHSVQQDLHQSHIYINRLKKYLDSSSTMVS